jgi:hypothetical protein
MQTAFVAAERSASVLPGPPIFPVPHDAPSSQSVLRLAILIADAAGEILFWNEDAREALERLSGDHPVGGLRDIFSADVLDRLQARGSWVVVRARGAPDVAFRVRVRRLFDTGRSLFLFFPDSAPS